jgi:4-amino-4-deoxy-L-arabinose transferase-like glycosyltransferase
MPRERTTHDMVRASREFAPLAYTSILLALGSAATFVTVECATYLGFNLYTYALYPAAALILASSLLVARKLTSFQRALGLFFERLRLNALIVVVVLSLAVRLIYVQYASVFPDEYSTLKILEARPLTDLPSFLGDYQRYAGVEPPHPPLSFILMSIGYSLLPTPAGARMVSVIFSTTSVVVVYLIMVELGKREYALPVAAIYSLVPHTVLFLSLALTDVYMNFFGLLAILMYLKALRGRPVRNAILAGASLGLSFWSKLGLALFWTVAIVILTFVLQDRKRLFRRSLTLGVALLVCGTVYQAWYGMTHASASLTSFAWYYLVNVVLRPGGYQVVTSGNIPQSSTTTSGGVPSLISAISALVFPKLSESRFGYISYPELIVQMALCLSPVVALLSLWGIISAIGRGDRRDLFLFVWAVVPLIAMIPGIRDVRYLLLFSAPVAYFSALGSRVRASNLRRYLRSLMFGFTVIFLIITVLVAQQQYSGLAETSHDLSDLGLGSARILTNALQISYYLPSATVYYLAPEYNASAVLRMVAQDHIGAVVILHNARAAWLPIGDTVLNGLKSEFHRYLRGGISAFSWYEIYY